MTASDTPDVPSIVTPVVDSTTSGSCPPHPPRPHLDDPDVLLAAVDQKWSVIVAWMVNNGDDAEDVRRDADAIKQQFVDALENSDSGYGVCRTLDRDGWSPDDDLVEIMGDVLQACHGRLRVAEEKWVTANNIRSTLGVGDRVTVPKHSGSTFSSPRVDGEIIDIDRAHGSYTVFCESLGHTRKGARASGGVHVYGLIITYEDTLPAAATAATVGDTVTATGEAGP